MNAHLLSQNIQGMTGTPMVAASPERHDGGLQANPVEVQSYQPPWKVLSDFALQSDLEQPSFQQLVCLPSLTGLTGAIEVFRRNLSLRCPFPAAVYNIGHHFYGIFEL